MLEGRGVQGGPLSCGVADAPLPSPVSTRVETVTRAARSETRGKQTGRTTRPIQIEKHDVSHEEQR